MCSNDYIKCDIDKDFSITQDWYIILESAVEIVVSALKLMKVQVIFAKFFAAVLTRKVKKTLQRSPVDSDD